MTAGTSEALTPGATIGILGGGQLGRMLAIAAARLGFRVVIYEPAADCPAARTADDHVSAAWDDMAALDAFAARCDVVTYEFENVPVETVERIAATTPVRPGAQTLAVAQDRLHEKDFIRELGIATAPYVTVDDAQTLNIGLANPMAQAGAILKTRRLGYDGKGQLRLKPGDNADDAWEQMAGAPCVLEGFVDFELEISVVAARGTDGAFRAFDPAHNVHRDGILRSSTVPAPVSVDIVAEAERIARAILEGLDYCGVMGVECFVARDGTLLVNEIAPRVHNSGHWTEAACLISQFEQHIRAVAGLPLGDPARHSDCVMENLIGDDVDRYPELVADGDCLVHLYGKAETRPGRKMGHVTWLSPLGESG